MVDVSEPLTSDRTVATSGAGREGHPDRVTWLIRDVVPFLALAALAGVAVRRGLAPLTNDDTFFHLRFGHEFLSEWTPWAPTSVTTLATRDWVPTQWLSQIVMAKTEDIFGMAGVAWLFGLTFLGFVLALWRACRQQATPLAAALVTVVAFVASAQGMSARPQMISYIFVVVVTSAWLRTHADGQIRWWLVPLTWLWAMLHGMWVISVIISLVAVAGLVLDGSLDRRRGRLAALVPLGSLLLAGLTPVGPRMYAEIVGVASRAEYFGEWGPPEYTTIFPMMLAALFATTLLVLLRQGPLSWTNSLLLLQAGGWAVYSARTVPVAAAMIAPLAAAAFQSLMGDMTVAGLKEKRLVLAGGGLALIVMAALAPSLVTYGPKHPDWEEHALGALPPGTVLLNDWQWGGYLMWEHPHLNVVMHGYGDTFTRAELDRNVALTRAESGWLEDLEETGAMVALLEAESDLAYALEQFLGWKAVHADDDVVLLTAPGTRID
jgi:hypothetical protein